MGIRVAAAVAGDSSSAIETSWPPQEARARDASAQTDRNIFKE
jgi:hypothetical protein